MNEPFGRYVLVEEIGRGGMAEIFRAVSHGVEGFQRVFVIKRILQDRSASPRFIEMFVNEARISALLNHPNIVQIYEFGQLGGSYFLAMEYLHGKDLLSVVRHLRGVGRLMMPADAAYVAQQVAAGLAYAHTLTQAGKPLNIIHRDVSPSNVMLLREGGVKLLDFGIAKAADEVLRGGHSTGQGLLKGKLSYLAPEQVRGDPIDHRSDIFSLGVVLWECLTGKRLFFDRTDYDTMKNVLERPIPPPSTLRAEIPASLDFIAVRALERDLDRRYPSAMAMVEDLEAFLQETRHSSIALPRLLNGLYGKETPEAGTSAPQAEHNTTEVPMSALTFAGGPGQAQPHHRKNRARWVVAACAAFAVCAAIILGLSWQQAGRHGAPPAPASGTVSLRVLSDPTGADVSEQAGRLVGQTPITFTLPRSSDPVVIRVSKAGFAPSQHSIVPDRDFSALITLRNAERPGTGAAQVTAPQPPHQIPPPAATPPTSPQP